MCTCLIFQHMLVKCTVHRSTHALTSYFSTGFLIWHMSACCTGLGLHSAQYTCLLCLLRSPHVSYFFTCLIRLFWPQHVSYFRICLHCPKGKRFSAVEHEKQQGRCDTTRNISCSITFSLHFMLYCGNFDNFSNSVLCQFRPSNVSYFCTCLLLWPT